MWILESDGEFLQGKRVWLRPGQRYLFGRVKKRGVFQAIDHGGVSRRHFVIQVDKVKEGDGAKLHSRSKITVIDENSKTGTEVDGEELRGTSKELKGTEHFLKLGTYPHQLVVKWHPVCLSFFLTAKEKKKPDALTAKRTLLEPFDIKVVQTFVMNQTTYVVASKRNTVPGLQALISGKYIVDNSYVDALVCATTPDDLEEEENLSPLEKDFDGTWPDPVHYLPSPGKEPTTKPTEAYTPSPDRAALFENWTFVFLEAAQHETLLPAISTGQGKALIFRLEKNKTTADDLLHYMRNSAGEKKFGETLATDTTGGVIMVKPVLKGDMAAWADELVNQVAVSLNQKCIDQADFLDAILANDASSLRVSLPHESLVGNVGQAPSIGPPGAQDLPRTLPNPNGEASSPAKAIKENSSPVKRVPRAPPVSRVKAFASAFDTDNIPAYEPIGQDSEDEAVDSPGLFSQHDDVDLNETPQANGHASKPSKRSRSPDEGDLVDRLVPAAAALKRRKISLLPNPPTKEAPQPARPVLVKKELDVRQAARARVAAQDSAAQRDRDALAATFGATPISEMKNLVVVEEMAVVPHQPTNGATQTARSERWDSAWNGRKNFKRFRVRGEQGTNPRRLGQGTIVPLVEVSGKTYGIGESYRSRGRRDDRNDSLNNSNSNNNNNLSYSSTNTPPRRRAPNTEIDTFIDDAEDDADDAPRRSFAQPRRRQQPPEDNNTFETPPHHRSPLESIDPETPPLTDKTRQSQQSMNATHGRTRGRGGKRPAAMLDGDSGAGSAAAADTARGKRPRLLQTRIPTRGEESEDEEELRFKFSEA